MGTYLGTMTVDDDDLYEVAIIRALERGVNVVDSAINYRAQRSERAVGQALLQTFETKVAERSEILVCSKAGFVPFDGSKPEDPRAYIQKAYVDSGVFTWEDFVARCHCLAPAFIRNQIEHSRENFGLETIDVYYLHNPETQLTEISRGAFRERMRAAFEVLEQARADGWIGVYGVATWNGFRQTPDAPDYLSLEEILSLAQEAGGPDHGFAVIQLPFNAQLTEAFSHRNQGTKCLLDTAAEHGIYVMTSASIMQGRLARELPEELAAVFPGLETPAQRSLQFVRSAPGVGTALVGMKQPVHVDENTALARMPPADPTLVRALFALK